MSELRPSTSMIPNRSSDPGPLDEADPSRTIQIGSLLLTEELIRVVTLLKKNADIFA